MTDGTLMVLAFAGLFSVIAVVVIWQLAATWRAKAVLVREQQYRELADRAVGTHEETRTRVESLDTRLSEINHRLAAIEKALTVID